MPDKDNVWSNLSETFLDRVVPRDEAKPGTITIVYSWQSFDLPDADDVAVVCWGHSGPLEVPDNAIRIDPKVLHKQNAATDLPSMVHLMSTAPPSFLKPLAGLLKGKRRLFFLVEDASPDSCAALLITLQRLAAPKDWLELPAAWQAHITAWETLGLDTGPDLSRCFGMLHNAMVHIDIFKAPANAWRDGLTLMAQLLDLDEDPLALSDQALALPIARRASTLLEFERREYLAALQSGEQVQILVPLLADKERKMLVDVLISQEGKLQLGVKKVFARLDRDNSPLGQGFSVLALQRLDPDSQIEEIVFSADGTLALDLSDFWRALEAAEESKWGQERPRDTPRHGLEYAFGETEVPNEPWYVDRTFSLIASPRAPHTTRLSWEECLDILWECYNPVSDAPLFQYSASWTRSCWTQSSIETLQPAYVGPNRGPRLFIAAWAPHNVNDLGLVMTDTIERILAAKLMQSGNDTSPISLTGLPSSNDLTRFDLNAGHGVVCNNDMFILMRRQLSDKQVSSLVAVFERMCLFKQNLEDVSNDMKDAIQQTGNALVTNPSTNARGFMDNFANLSSIQLRLMNDIATRPRAAIGSDQQIINDKLEQNWRTQEMILESQQVISDFKTLLTTNSELLSNRRIANLTLFGFPLVLLSGFFGFIFRDVPREGDPQAYIESIHWTGLFLFVGASIVGMILISLFQVSRRGRRKTSAKDRNQK